MGRHKNKRKARRAGVIFLFACALLCATLFLRWAFNKSEPLILPLAEREFCDLITNIVYDALEKANPEDAVIPCYNEEGDVTYMRTNTRVVNDMVSLILDEIDSTLGSRDIKIAIPIGDIVGDALSLGQGPDILVELNQYKSTRAEVKSSIESAGINQTLHRLILYLDIEAVVLLPGLNAGHITASLALPVAETIIVGDIPKTYIN